MATDLTNAAPTAEAGTDIWAEWLLKGRHGGDPNHELIMRGMVQRIRDRVLDGARLSTGMVLVDVGTGDGLVAFGALERVGRSLKVVLTDVSARLLKHAEGRASERGLQDCCAFVQTSAERMEGVADQSADVVTTRASLAYVADKAAAVRQFYRVLKAGGRVSLGEPIYQDAAVKLAALTRVLQSRPADEISAQARLLQRCRAAQLPSTVAEIKSHPLTNFTERDLVVMFQNAGFTDIHLELHIDVRKGPAVPWDTFIDMAPRPGAPSLRAVFASHLNETERLQLEKSLRPLIESGQQTESDAIAYLTAVKPSKAGKSSESPKDDDAVGTIPDF